MQDKWIRIIGYPIVIVVMSYVYGRSEWEIGGIMILKTLFIASLFTVAIWEGCRQIILFSRKRFPGYPYTTQRIIVQSTLALLYTALAKLTINWVVALSFGPDACISANSLSPTLDGLLIFIPLLIVSLVYEAAYFFQAWKENIKQTEALAHAHMESQFEALKKQLDPHFLFNSLNTLSSLISLDNEPAQDYLDRLADVYRYVLDTRDKSTVSLEEELTFLEAYMYLNQVRFRENLQLENAVSKSFYQQRIPSLSLQLLVENAIKHNVVAQDQPLHIRIFEENDRLVVENNKQLKTSLAHSTRIGLKNLMERYRLLGNDDIQVFDDAKRFAVSIPLLS